VLVVFTIAYSVLRSSAAEKHSMKLVRILVDPDAVPSFRDKQGVFLSIKDNESSSSRMRVFGTGAGLRRTHPTRTWLLSLTFHRVESTLTTMRMRTRAAAQGVRGPGGSHFRWHRQLTCTIKSPRNMRSRRHAARCCVFQPLHCNRPDERIIHIAVPSRLY